VYPEDMFIQQHGLHGFLFAFSTGRKRQGYQRSEKQRWILKNQFKPTGCIPWA
jgi:hypothetical protein